MAVVAALFAAGVPVAAPLSQAAPPTAADISRGGMLDSRTQLEQRLKTADSAGRTDEAAAIRARLAQGDFREGDRIVVTISGDVILAPEQVAPPTLPETLTVRAGSLVDIRRWPPLSLQGVLRTELRDHVDRHVRRFIVNPSVRASSLMRVGVLGSVGRPSYYDVPPSSLVSEVINVAAGYLGTADLTKVSVRREGALILSTKETLRAIAEGRTLDGMGLMSGDEIHVEAKTPSAWMTWLQVGLGLVGVVIAVTQTGRR